MRIAPIFSLALVTAVIACAPVDQTGAEADSTAPDSTTDEGTGGLQEEQQLTGIRWELVSLGDSAIEIDSTAKTPYILLLEDENRVEGSGTCNGFGGPYELNGHSIRFGPLAATLMACAEGMEVEAGFFTALEHTGSWAISGDTLKLADSGGTVVAQFRDSSQ